MPPSSEATGDAIRILVVDDHPLLRDGIAALLANQPSMALAGEASNGSEAVERYRALRPDVTLMDLQMPGMSGLDAVITIRGEFPDARILVLTTYKGDVPASKVLRAGASGYLLKSGVRTQLLEAIRRIHSGGRYVPDEVLREINQHPASDHLTERELMFMRGVARGQTNKDIAAVNGVSVETVKLALKTIFLKLGASDRTEAAMIATQRGFLDV